MDKEYIPLCKEATSLIMKRWYKSSVKGTLITTEWVNDNIAGQWYVYGNAKHENNHKMISDHLYDIYFSNEKDKILYELTWL